MAASVEVIDETKNTNLHLLAMIGDHQTLKQFQSETKVDVQNSYGLTPLMFAARYGHLEALKALLDLRADATKTNKYGGSVFLMAVASGNLDVINVLLQHLLSGGVSRQVIETCFSPISMSILFGHEHVFKFLIGSKFNIKSITRYTELTPLMFAVLNKNPVFTKHLLLLGADPRARNANNETCHDLEKRLKGAEQEQDEQKPPTGIRGPEKLHITIPQHQQQQMQPVQAPAPQAPVLLVSQPHFYNQIPFPRKSSTAITPEVMTPTISPLGFYPQVFFPTDFTPTQFGSPTVCIPYQHPFFRQDYIVSPVYNIQSPFTSMHNVNITEDVFFAG